VLNLEIRHFQLAKCTVTLIPASPRLRHHMQLDSSLLLKIADHTEQIVSLRTAARAEHPDQAFGRRIRRFAKFFEADGGLDIAAQDRFAGFNIAAEHRVDPFAQKVLGKAGLVATAIDPLAGASIDPIFKDRPRCPVTVISSNLSREDHLRAEKLKATTRPFREGKVKSRSFGNIL
jgi:hypothetical protein